MHGGKFIEIDFDSGGGIFSLGTGITHAHREKLTDLTHLLVGQNGLLGFLEPRYPGYGNNRLYVLDIRRGEYAAAKRFRDSNLTHPGVRKR